jgi:hypothetical protein
MAALSISRAWEETKARIASDGRLIAIVAAATLLLPQAVVTVVAPPEQLSGERATSTVNILMLVAAFVGMIGQIAIIRMALVHAAGVGESIQHGVRRFFPAFAAAFILVIAMFVIMVPLMIAFAGAGDLESVEAGTISPAVGMAVLLMLVLALFVGVRFLLLMPVATAEAGGPIHILKRSWSLSSGHYLRLLGFMFLILIAAIIVVVTVQFVGGAIVAAVFAGDVRPLSLGALVYALLFGAVQAGFAAVLSVMLARIYVQLAGEDVERVSVPSSGT